MKPLFYFNDDVFSYDEIIIYGCGMAACGIFRKLLQRNVKVLCFADSNPDNCGQSICGIPVVNIRKLADKYDSAAFIVGGKYLGEVSHELIKTGVKNLFYDYANEVGVIHLGGDDYLI